MRRRHDGRILTRAGGGALLVAMKKLLAAGEIEKDEWIVLFNTGSGIKYLEAFEN